jgi:hypothetical protein
MNKPSYADRIRDQIKAVEQKIAALNSELADLRAAQRVIQRFEVEPEDSSEVAELQDGFVRAFVNPGRRSEQRTISDAVISKLHENGPMDSGAILNQLREAWRPDLNVNTLLSTLSRMKVAGRIINKDRQWMLPQTEEALSSSQLDNASKPDVVESHLPNNVND